MQSAQVKIDNQRKEHGISSYLFEVLCVSDEFQEKRVSEVNSNCCTLNTIDGDPFVAVMFSSPEELNSAEAALKNLIQHSETISAGIVTDGTLAKSRVLRRRFDRSEFEYLKDTASLGLSGRANQTLVLKNLPNKAHGRLLSLLTDRVENVFFEVHSHLRDIDGLHADGALDELCKLIYLKLYDEETTKEGQAYKAQRWLYSGVEECAAAVRSLYQKANENDIRVFSLKIPGYKRSRGVFDLPIRLSSPALAKAVETLQEYNFSQSSTDIKGRAFQKVLGPAMRSGMGQYFTPDPVARLLSHMVRPSVHDLILDPFCGSGHFLTNCLQIVRDQHKRENKLFHEFAFGKLHGIEKSDRMVRVAMTDMRLHGDGHSNIRCTDSLLAFTNYQDLQPASFDVILTNPPFGSLLGPESILQLGHFELAKSKKNVPLEIVGLERCVQLLRPGGRLGIVLPDGVLANKNSAYVRHWLNRYVKVRAVVGLPLETFVPFGASIKTSILLVRKWMPGENSLDEYPVFLGRVDNIGYDATGRSHEGSDLEDLEEAFSSFLTREGW